MWHLVAAGILTGAVAVALHMIAPTPAYACSAGPDFDPVANSTVIVEGRVLGYQVVPGEPMPGSEEARASSAYVPALFEMTVERVLKGDVSTSTFTFVDNASLSHVLDQNGEHQWWGSGGACGAFDLDPTGRYAIMGLWRDQDGELHSSRFQVFYLGDAAGGERYDRALQRMASFPGASALPALGAGPGASSPAATLTVAGIMAMMGTALLSLVVLSRIHFRRST